MRLDLGWLALPALLLATPPYAAAASFDCAKAASHAEKAICADSSLSALDTRLAEAWKRALSSGGDLSALKSSQLQWLNERNACDEDALCLSDRYRERLATLSGSPLAKDRWQQTWYLDSKNPTVGAVLTFSGAAPRLHFSIESNNGGHEGALDGDIVLHGDRATFHKDACKLDFSRVGSRIEVEQKGADTDCEAGMDVSYAGSYVPFAQFRTKPKADLLSLHVLTDPAQNAAAYTLLGRDYQTLVDTINSSGGDEPDIDHLDAAVDTYWVLGLAPTNASIVMRQDSRLWVGLLVGDARGETRMRYYTNVAQWKKRVPKTIRAWHDNIDKAMPIDVMP